MCGIVGLHLRTPELYPRLGELLTGMLCQMGDRGSDSTGVAVYGDPVWSPPGRGCVSVVDVAHDAVAADEMTASVSALVGAPVDAVTVDATYLLSSAVPSETLLDAVTATYPEALIAGFGSDIAVLKGVGHPQTLTSDWGLAKAQGWQGVGHTRMATESAVTTEHSHPFAVSPDLALVHNGSFSNYASVRRRLAADGIRFDTDNDSEVAARYIAREMAAGADLPDALRGVMKVFDGFFTLLVAAGQSLAIVRDSFACKPMVVAETADYVAVASEYVALADLPGVDKAQVFEPMPEEIYTWQA